MSGKYEKHFSTANILVSIGTVMEKKSFNALDLPFFPLSGQFVIQPSFFQALSFLSSTLPEVFLWAVVERDI